MKGISFFIAPKQGIFMANPNVITEPVNVLDKSDWLPWLHRQLHRHSTNEIEQHIRETYGTENDLWYHCIVRWA